MQIITHILDAEGYPTLSVTIESPDENAIYENDFIILQGADGTNHHYIILRTRPISAGKAEAVVQLDLGAEVANKVPSSNMHQ